MERKKVAVIGAGLAGCECAMSLSRQGIGVTLYEMKPEKFSPAHTSEGLAELVCSNSFRSDAEDSAVGQLKYEMRQLNSLVMEAAEETRVPAGKALAVDRERFSAKITQAVKAEAHIEVVRREITSLAMHDGPLKGYDAVVVAAGPLASDSMAEALQTVTGQGHLYFYDAIAPVVDSESINMDVAFWGGRYEPESRDYLNCPLSYDEYMAFYNALLEGKKSAAHDFEEEKHFEGCMPIEALAERGVRTLTFGSMKPVGFVDPRTGERPHALLQLRAENINKSMFNLVGCQTKLLYAEQERIFRMIPGLEHAEFVRFGSMHRNTFVNAPQVLSPTLELRSLPNVYLAGQITGVEGYVESAACGLWLGMRLGIWLRTGKELPLPPQETALGALLGHLQTPAKHFQPSNVQFGLMPALGVRAKKADRKHLYVKRAREMFLPWLETMRREYGGSEYAENGSAR